MTEKELGQALLNLEAFATPDPKRMVKNILAKDQRRVQVWKWLAILTWLLATVLIFADLVNFGLIFPLQAHVLQQIDAGTVTAAERDQLQRISLIAFEKGTLLIAFAVAIMALAALFSLLLLLASRRATLRQMNASLMEISEQLKQLSIGGAKP